MKCFSKSQSSCHKSRYCNQNNFKLLICGGFNSEAYKNYSHVSCLDFNKVRDVEAYPSMKIGRLSSRLIYLKGDIYVFGGKKINNNWIKYVDKYSLTSKKWSKVAKMPDDRKNFCVCAFMDKILVIGGDKDEVPINSCLQFDTSNYSWKEVAKMNEARSSAACEVFEERIVVSGGLSTNPLNTVESYDVLPNKWSTMPKMNSGKYIHSLVVVKNKLFVISKEKNSCEVFDNFCKKFITIKSPEFKYLSSRRAFSIENKIFALQDDSSKIITYDTNKNEWSEESCEVTNSLQYFSCVKVPCL